MLKNLMNLKINYKNKTKNIKIKITINIKKITDLIKLINILFIVRCHYTLFFGAPARI